MNRITLGRTLALATAATLVSLAAITCSDSSLYGVGMEDPSADRLGLTGRVCTDDPQEAGFPVKVIFLVDVASGPMFAEFDLEGQRIQALRDTLSIHNGNEAFSFAVISFASSPRLLAPEEGFFTRDPGELDNAVAMLALPQGCTAGICRDYDSALDLVRSVIEGDMADLTAGERSRTQYSVVMLAGGRPDPWTCSYECCDPTTEDCDYSVCTPSQACTGTFLSEKVVKLREDVEEDGALSLSLHTLFLATGTEEENDAWGAIFQDMTFVGAGRFERFNSADALTLDHIGLLKISSLLESKALIVTNKSTLPGLEDPEKDSDGDGLGDAAEEAAGTSKTLEDTDGDGINDFIEILVSFDPTVGEEPPQVCSDLDFPYTDGDSDTLNECEELLIGTDPSLPDTDGDGIPDWMEVSFGTDYLRDDSLQDADGDGVLNGGRAHGAHGPPGERRGVSPGQRLPLRDYRRGCRVRAVGRRSDEDRGGRHPQRRRGHDRRPRHPRVHDGSPEPLVAGPTGHHPRIDGGHLRGRELPDSLELLRGDRAAGALDPGGGHPRDAAAEPGLRALARGVQRAPLPELHGPQYPSRADRGAPARASGATTCSSTSPSPRWATSPSPDYTVWPTSR